MRTRNGTIGAVIAAVVILALMIPLGAGVAGAATETLVARGSVWRYLDNGTDQGTAWRAPGFADGAWKSGPAEFGYGDGHELTVVSYGPDASHKYKTTYFRRTFSVTNPGAVTALALGIRRDDGAAVYLNGTEVARSNLPTGALTYLSDATTWDVNETAYNAFTVPTSALVAGTNTIAVEIHQNGWASSDLSMDLDLTATTTSSTTTSSTVPSGPQTLVSRGSVWKYLDNGTDQGTAWRAPGFADGAWKSGPAEFGYGDGHEQTVVSYGPDATHRYKTTYFRRTFTVADPGAVTALSLGIRRDDGAAVYLNGTEVARSNLPTGALTYLSDATTWDIDETAYNPFTVPVSVLVAGSNTIAVEIHQNGWASSDISMDLELLATTGGTTTTTPPTTTTPVCASLGAATAAGQVGDAAVTESSGLAAGVRSPGVLYTHNDSGDTARFFAMSSAGRALGRFSLAGADATDWEDMAVGRGPVAGQSYLYLADFGGPRNPVVVYRVPEPQVSATGPTSTATTALSGVTRFDLSYPDGVARNAETLLVDPVDRSVNIVTKTTSGTSEVFRFVPGTDGGSVTPTRVRSIAIPAGGNLETTGGSVSPDGSTIAVRTYDRMLRWHRPAGVTVADALAGVPCVDALAWQPQGEAVAFAADGRSLLVTSEGSSSAITAYSLP